MITTCKLVPDLSTNGNNQCEHICWQAVIFYASLSHPNHQNWFLTKMNFLPRSSIWLPEGAGNDIYIITTEKHAIWLVKSRAASGYPARGILMPSRDFRGILKMSLFYCSYFIKQLPNGFPSNIAWTMHLGCCSTFGKRKNTLAPNVLRHPSASCMDHAILHEKPFGIPLFRASICQTFSSPNFMVYLPTLLEMPHLKNYELGCLNLAARWWAGRRHLLINLKTKWRTTCCFVWKYFEN
jgi:hypothetical protein